MKIDSEKFPLPPRMRHHTASNLYIPWDELKTKPDFYPPLYESVNWSEHYANGQKPDCLDVGCGKGQLLLDYAENNPKENILGIELRVLPVNWLKEVIQGYYLPNVSVLWYSVVNGLGFIEDNSINKIFYLFPDPWPKKKHQKRRAFTSFLLNEFQRILKPDGHIYLATDVPEVHEYHIQVLAENSRFETKIITGDAEWDLPVTNKEKFCRLKDIHFDRIICRLK